MFDDLKTPCGIIYGFRLDKRGDDQNVRCKSCKTLIDEEDFQHDGYEGSEFAHNGAGSSGMGRHHFFAVCSSCHSCECATCLEANRRSKLSSWEKAVEDLKKENGGFLYETSGSYFVSDDFLRNTTVLLPHPFDENKLVWSYFEEGHIEDEVFSNIDWDFYDPPFEKTGFSFVKEKVYRRAVQLASRHRTLKEEANSSAMSTT